MDVFDLQARISLDSSAYEQGLEDAKDSASSFGSYLGTAMKVAGGTIAAVTGAISGVSAAFISATGSVAAYGDNVDKMSQKMGISAKAFQEWDAVLQHSGTDISVLRSSMRQLVNAAQGGSEAFQALGISQKEAASMSQEDLFSATIEALQNVEDQTQRTYIANKLLGRGAMELGALLNTSAEDTQKMKERVHELNGVMSDGAVKAAAAYQDSLQDMSTAFEGLKRNMTAEFLPAVTTVMDGLADLFAGNSDKGLAAVTEGITKFTDSLSDTLPKVLDIGYQIITALTSSIIDNLPGFVQSTIPPLLSATEIVIDSLIRSLPPLLDSIVTVIPPVLKDIATTLIKEIPTVAGAAVQAASDIISDVGEALPEIVPLAVQAVGDMIDAITAPETLDMILDAGLELSTGLAQGIGEAIPRLADTVTDVITNVVKFFGEPENTTKIISAAFEIIGSLAGGILQAIPELAYGLGEVIYNIGSTLKNADWEKIGSDIMQAISVGVSVGGDFVVSAVEAGLGAVDRLFDTHLADWYREVTDFWRDAGANIYEVLHADEIDATAQSIKVSELRRDIAYAVNDFIREGNSAADALEKAKDKLLLTPEDVYLWERFISNDLTLEDAENRAAIIESVAKQYELSMHLPTEALRQMRGEQAQALSELPKMYGDAFDEATEAAVSKTQSAAETLNEETKKELKSQQQNAYDDAKEYIRLHSKIEEWSYSQTLEAYQTLRSKYAEGTKEYNELSEKIYDISKSNTKQLENEANERAKAAENEAKEFEQAAKKVVADQKKALKEREEAYAEYQKSIEAIKANIDALEKNYTDTLESRTQEIFNSFNLFDKVPERIAVSGVDLMDNLRDQYDTIAKFYSDIEKLSTRGVSEALVAQIRDMGVGALDQLDALLDLDDKQLSEYDKLFTDKQELAAGIAEKELAGLKAETEAKIADEMSQIEALNREAGEKLGLNFAESIAEGIISGTDNIAQSLGVVFQAASDLFYEESPYSAYNSISAVQTISDTEPGTSAVNRGSVASAATENVTVNINGIQYQNFSELVRAVSEELSFQMSREAKGYVGAV